MTQDTNKAPSGSVRVGDESYAQSFDAIVIGSGYGGAVAAYRLAQAGLSVCVMEKGYEHKAPNMPRGRDSEWAPEEGRFGPHTVTKLNKRVTGWHGTAVGGGSIVNAAVMIRKDCFENWPGNITRETLDPYYDRAEQMLGARVYPLHSALSPYAATIKTSFMLKAGERLGVPTVMPPVAVTYRENGEAVGTVKTNQFGAQQQGCRQCGECSLPGCNYQAKNSLDFNYLHGAQHQYGATILPGHEVTSIKPLRRGGYSVVTEGSRDGRNGRYHAKIVVVAAGSLGSSELLLRNKHHYGTLPALSAALGRQYTTNGTFIGFAIRGKEELDPAGGPEITAGLDFNGPDGKNQGHLVFDGSFRGFSYETFYITGRLIGLKNWTIKLISSGFKLAEKTGLLQPKTSLPLLVIGRDNAVGTFSLDKNNRLVTDLNPDDNASFYKRANAHMRALTRAMGTSFLKFPHWSLQGKIDVPHNLGGVPMGRTSLEGVVDDMGRVYGYENLLVLDGSIVPATMGANPALTIAALAERSMETVIPQFKEGGVIRPSAAVPDVVPPTRDRTALFNTIHRQVAEKNAAGNCPQMPLAASPKKVLWVPGILARHMGNHSVTVLARMRQLGLNVEAVPVNTDVATRENVQLLQSRINELEDGEGILIGHSRGGIMCLDAYLGSSPQAKAKVAHIIIIQSPVNGTPLADLAIKTGLRRKLVASLSRLVFGNNIIDTAVELSTRGRAAAQRALPPLTAEDRTKIITLRSTIEKGQSPSFDLTRGIMAAKGQQSDGVTPYEMSAIRGVSDITLKGYDHENLVIQNPTFLKRLTRYRPNKDYEAGNVIEALLRMILTRDRL
jgi:cholesterol oxidase